MAAQSSRILPLLASWMPLAFSLHWSPVPPLNTSPAAHSLPGVPLVHGESPVRKGQCRPKVNQGRLPLGIPSLWRCKMCLFLFSVPFLPHTGSALATGQKATRECPLGSQKGLSAAKRLWHWPDCGARRSPGRSLWEALEHAHSQLRSSLTPRQEAEVQSPGTVGWALSGTGSV